MELKDLLSLAERAAKSAGEAIMSHYDDFETWNKPDKSPLTTADLAANYEISKILSASNLEICSEESVLDYEQRANLSQFWVVDPLDGTKEFIAKNGEFCVCIALVKNSRPILGVLYAPVTKELLSGGIGLGVYKNGVKIGSKSNSNNHPLIMLLGRYGLGKKRALLCENLGYEISRLGSALKFMRLCDGSAGIYIRTGESCWWDICAGDLLLTLCGGEIIDLKTLQAPLYGGKSLLNHSFIALSSSRLKDKEQILNIMKEID